MLEFYRNGLFFQFQFQLRGIGFIYLLQTFLGIPFYNFIISTICLTES